LVADNKPHESVVEFAPIRECFDAMLLPTTTNHGQTGKAEMALSVGSRWLSREWYSFSVDGDCVGGGSVQSETARGGKYSVRLASVAPASVALYLAVVLGLFVAILHRDSGVFTYTLDDPYIHLALAENIAHGHYGINPGEISAPSSSIVWPFLLVPAAREAWGRFLPLALNIIFCGLAAWRIGRIVDGWAGIGRQFSAPSTHRGETAMNGAHGHLSCGWLGRMLLAATLMLVANLAGLTFVGMEHGLQVLLAILCAEGLIEAFAGRRIPWWCLVAAAVGPMVRYENFALLVAVAIALVGQRRGRTAAQMVGLSLIGPALFSIFLVSHGLSALPSSVLLKTSVNAPPGSSWMAVVRRMYWVQVHEPAWWEQLLVAGVLATLLTLERERVRRSVLTGTLVAAFLQLTVGHVNWFFRYEVYAMIFTVLVAATALVETKRLWWGTITVGLLALGTPYKYALSDTPAAASNVFQQQYQMHRFVTEFYRHTVAVNDLGLVSYRRPTGIYVLDLYGLASPEAAHEKHKNAGWMDEITNQHQAGLAMIYPDWYEEGAPDDWEPLGTMCITGERLSVAYRCVVFYSTAVGDTEEMRSELADFTRTLPKSVKMTLGRDASVKNP